MIFYLSYINIELNKKGNFFMQIEMEVSSIIIWDVQLPWFFNAEICWGNLPKETIYQDEAQATQFPWLNWIFAMKRPTVVEAQPT